MANPLKAAVKFASRAFVGIGLLLVIAGLLASRHWAAPTTTWTAMGSIATVAAAFAAIWTLFALKQDSRDRTRPVMIAEIRPAVLSEVAELIVRNVGPSVAKNVTFAFHPELPKLEGIDAAGKLTPYLQRRYSRTMPTFGPGMIIHDVYQTNPPYEPVPDDFTLKIDYYDTHGRRYSDSYELTVKALRDHTRSTPTGDDESELQRRLVRAVEAIARGVGRR
ncbi:hypothetical protein [Mycobacterium marinum]|uniref:hypothetical protein n=1 Tax=Mycobacterium marinum TaxID=1781 RepID=UPI00115CDC24|nr:hypothetical protein [Mycobacterium marinum]